MNKEDIDILKELKLKELKLLSIMEIELFDKRLDILKEMLELELSSKIKVLNDKYPNEGEFFFYWVPFNEIYPYSGDESMSMYYEMGVGTLYDGVLEYKPSIPEEAKNIKQELRDMLKEWQTKTDVKFFMDRGLIIRVFHDRVDSGFEMHE